MKKAIKLIENVLRTPIEKVVCIREPESWTSLAHMLIITELEHMYNIVFTDEEVIQASILKRLIELIGEKIE